MKKIYPILIVVILAACTSQSKNQKEAGTTVNSSELLTVDESVETDTYISSIEFELHATKEDMKYFEDGIVPWISIENPEAELDRLIDADKLVITKPELTLVIDYPVANPIEFVLKSSNDKGFTTKQLVLAISKKYHEIYAEEEKTASTKTIPENQRKGLMNRNETNGKYGIWGHDMADLDLSEIEIYQSKNGKIKLLLGIES